MKFPSAVAIMLLTASPCALNAQPQDAPPPPLPQSSAPASPAGRGDASTARPNLSPDQMANALATRLALTDDQKTKITPILAGRQQQMKALQADTSSRPMQKMKRMKEITEDSDKKINAILTPDQRKQYAELEQQRRQQMQEQRKNGSN
jgi:Spy/CpxP family protein refolding chaperone